MERDYDNRQSGRKTEPFNYNKIGGGNDSGYQIHQERENNYGQANAYSQAEIDKELENGTGEPFLYLVMGYIPSDVLAIADFGGGGHSLPRTGMQHRSLRVYGTEGFQNCLGQR